MYQLKYTLRTLSPVLITSISGDTNMVSTLDYIPGSVLRGAFTAKYIENLPSGSKAHEEPFFNDCFLNSGLCFSNAYILKEENSDAIHYPTPISIMKVKTKESNIFDLIQGIPEEQTKSLGKYCEINGNNIYIAIPSKSINLHNTRKDNRLKGCSDDGSIFNYESIDAGQEFSGKIIGSKKDIEKISALFSLGDKILVGRSKTIQYGKTEITRISKIQEYISETGTFKKEKLANNFFFTFLSPAIFYNNYGFSTTSLSDFKYYLANSIGINTENIEIKQTFKKAETVENFISIWLLKTPSETCMKAGSCFEITISDWNENIKESLIELQKTGIGERTGEGFGRFALNLQESKEYKLQEETENKNSPEKIENLKCDIPELTKEIIKSVVIKSYYAIAESEALKDYKDFCENKERIPTNSLLGKLESILKSSSKMEEFIDTINGMPPLTKEKLDKCKNKNVKLIDHANKEIKILEILKNNPELQESGLIIEFKPGTDEFKFELYKHYWITFLRSMRKEKQKGGD